MGVEEEAEAEAKFLCQICCTPLSPERIDMMIRWCSSGCVLREPPIPYYCLWSQCFLRRKVELA